MPPARKIALRVNGGVVANATLRRSKAGPELVIADPRLGEFAADETFTLELLKLGSLFILRKSEADYQTAAGGEIVVEAEIAAETEAAETETAETREISTKVNRIYSNKCSYKQEFM